MLALSLFLTGARVLSAITLVSLLSMSLSAQQPVAAALRASDNPHSLDLQRPVRSADSMQGAGHATYEMPVRTTIGVAGAFIGAYAGAIVGMNIPHSPCGCDDPGLSQALMGAAVGSAVLGAVIASAPQLSSRCGPLKRFGYGIAGAAAGAIAGGALGLATGGGGVILGYIGGSGIGSGVASALC